jgi:hypothetical protein
MPSVVIKTSPTSKDMEKIPFNKIKDREFKDQNTVDEQSEIYEKLFQNIVRNKKKGVINRADGESVEELLISSSGNNLLKSEVNIADKKN